MRGLGGIALCVLAAAAVAAGSTAHATSAAPLKAKSTIDLTYSCSVQKAKIVYVYAGTKLPATYNPTTEGKPSPGELRFSTASPKQVNGITTIGKSQATVVAGKRTVTVDSKTCAKQKKRIAFSPKRLPNVITATPAVRGFTSQACVAATTKVTFRLQVQLTGGKATSATFTVRAANAKGTPIALISWSPKAVTAHYASSCTPIAS